MLDIGADGLSRGSKAGPCLLIVANRDAGDNPDWRPNRFPWIVCDAGICKDNGAQGTAKLTTCFAKRVSYAKDLATSAIDRPRHGRDWRGAIGYVGGRGRQYGIVREVDTATVRTSLPGMP